MASKRKVKFSLKLVFSQGMVWPTHRQPWICLISAYSSDTNTIQDKTFQVSTLPNLCIFQ
eukprot:c31014_g1_i1 orf=1-177(-)